MGGAKNLLLQGKKTLYLLPYNAHLKCLCYFPRMDFSVLLYFLSFPSVSKAASPEGYLASGI